MQKHLHVIGIGGIGYEAKGQICRFRFPAARRTGGYRSGKIKPTAMGVREALGCGMGRASRVVKTLRAEGLICEHKNGYKNTINAIKH